MARAHDPVGNRQFTKELSFVQLHTLPRLARVPMKKCSFPLTLTTTACRLCWGAPTHAAVAAVAVAASLTKGPPAVSQIHHLQKKSISIDTKMSPFGLTQVLPSVDSACQR